MVTHFGPNRRGQLDIASGLKGTSLTAPQVRLRSRSPIKAPTPTAIGIAKHPHAAPFPTFQSSGHSFLPISSLPAGRALRIPLSAPLDDDQAPVRERALKCLRLIP